MKPQFLHVATCSFALWFDKWLLQKGEAFSNHQDQKLYYLFDERMNVGGLSSAGSPTFSTYSSPFKQWVNDSSINGAIVPNGVKNNGNDISRGMLDMKIDFKNGRVLFGDGQTPSVVDDQQNLTASFSVKDFNIYITNQDEETLITESKFEVNSRFFNSEKGIPPYSQVLPAIFINCKQTQNSPFSFGGEDETLLQFRCVVMADEVYKLDGALSVFNDARETCFYEVDYKDFPESEYGDNKYGDYNYDAVATAPAEKYYITEVVTSKMSDRLNKKVLPNLFIGFIDIDVVRYRFPRI